MFRISHRDLRNSAKCGTAFTRKILFKNQSAQIGHRDRMKDNACRLSCKKVLLGVQRRLMFQQGQPQRCVGNANCFSSLRRNCCGLTPPTG